MSTRWAMPVLGLLMGFLFLAAAAVGGQPGLGLGMFGVMAMYSLALVLFGERSETIAALGGRPVDERLASFNIRATAVAGSVAVIVALGGFLWKIAHGEPASDFAMVAAAAGVAYLGALVWLRLRG